MELLYIYIKKYRLFEKQEFSFSDKFKIHYDPVQNKLQIARNPDYFDLYPGNIVGISGIVGKNASGKSSLLTLIGQKPEDRLSAEEAEESSYFLLYYCGMQDHKDIFYLETTKAEDYPGWLSGYPEKAQKPNGRQYECTLSFDGHSIKEDFTYLGNIRTECSVISLNNRHHNTVDLSKEAGDLPRRYAPLVSDSIWDSVLFLSEQMRAKNTSLYRNNAYALRLRYIVIPGVPDLHLDFLSLKDRKCFGQKLKLTFIHSLLNVNGREKEKILAVSICILRYYLLDLLKNITRTSRSMEPFKPDFKTFSEVKIGEVPSVYELEDLKAQYVELIERIDPLVSKSHDALPILLLMNQLENYLQHCDICFSYSKGLNVFRIKITFQITASLSASLDHISRITMETFLDELQSLPCVESHLQWEIHWLSDGEAENLGLFAALHAQITSSGWYDRSDFFGSRSEAEVSYRDKKHFILLFDEIERCMHPEMCRRLLSDLIRFLNRYPEKRFQIIISTHSPFLIGDLRRENLICLQTEQDPSQPRPGQVTAISPQISSFGQNIHTLLRRQFFLKHTISEYARQTIDLLAHCLDPNANLSLAQIRQKLTERLGPKQENIPVDDDSTLRYLKWVIDSVGEPLLQDSLRRQLEQYTQKQTYEQEKQALLDSCRKELQKNMEIQLMERLSTPGAWQDYYCEYQKNQARKKKNSTESQSPEEALQQALGQAFEQIMDKMLREGRE